MILSPHSTCVIIQQYHILFINATSLFPYTCTNYRLLTQVCVIYTSMIFFVLNLLLLSLRFGRRLGVSSS
ncbi:hypothetical protein BDN67DRAFT_631150 [Paxillus ammoniavirescens]|nr:hypothetical protein BDN67DRAFT_631150 [Paxillus ammoniavirescens]